MSIPVVVQHAPHLTPDEAEALARERYGIAGRAEPLASERDQNFRISCADRSAYVLKIANTTEREEILDFQNAALAHLAAHSHSAEPDSAPRPRDPASALRSDQTDAASAPSPNLPSAPCPPVVGPASRLRRRAASAAQPARAADPASARSLLLPRVLPDRDGRLIGRIAPPGGSEHMVRMLTWVPGRVLAEVRPHSRALLRSLGAAAAEMGLAFEGFAHPGMRRELQWDLARTPWIRAELHRFTEAAQRALVEAVLARFEEHALPRLARLSRQVIHNDWNDYNVIVLGGRDARVSGAVDFGDMLDSWAVADVAVASAYAMLGKPDPVGATAVIVSGYHQRRPLTEDEIDVLPDLIRARLAISVTMAACQSAEAPGNEYLRISERAAWDLLGRLHELDVGWLICVLRDACGMPASRSSAPVRVWLAAHQADFGPVVDADLPREPLAVLDLSVGSLDIPSLSDVEQVGRFCSLVDSQLTAAGARVGIGRYDEARLVYVSELFRHADNWDVETRTVHLGIDVFLPAGSTVLAPLDGVVHSCRNNRGTGDYGPTIILQHDRTWDSASAGFNSEAPAAAESKPDAPLRFYTLYGHLSEDSIAGLQPGTPLAKGQVIARLGDVDVNGGWPPHLHFQVITDLLGHSGDFPGVAAPSERGIWLDLCLDPNAILGIPADRFPAVPPDGQEILSVRRRHLGPNLTVSYRRPLTIVRGHLQYLFDREGRRFLDAVNNVPHVGHSHPRVVAAAAKQLAVLNTNTRYLNPVLTTYVTRLAALMPDPLSVCYIVCSGSEANELALRLARAFTRKTSVVVVEGAYHGNTSSLVDISPYKFDGPGGGGRPPHVRAAMMPDVYRGRYKADDEEAGVKYAEEVAAAARELEAAGHGVAAFFCESLLSCGGQIVLPRGYLSHAYAAVRRAGGVCVADEVQVGFGRVGSYWWGFETQGVVPDIVTLGKPIGNGFPLGAVITTREIADAFDNGMEYFNTFGGSQAPCAVGHAVLDVMRDEGLQARAARVGGRLMDGLRRLKDRFPLVGDVRGLGLFVGVELVSDPATLEPAARQADYIVNRMRDRGILVSTDGPLHNVLKIKPPLQFSEQDAERLVGELSKILDEDGASRG